MRATLHETDPLVLILPECRAIHRHITTYRTKPNDVWAIGSILCNLITGRNPWHVASPREDIGFSMYMQEGAVWLHKNMDISLGTAACYDAAMAYGDVEEAPEF